LGFGSPLRSILKTTDSSTSALDLGSTARHSPARTAVEKSRSFGRESPKVSIIRAPERHMTQRIAAFLLVATVSGAPVAVAQVKKPITHDVYDGWKSIQGTKISRDGTWAVYALVPQDGDGELVVRNLKSGAEYRAPRGRNATITPDGTFVVFEKSPLKADVD